MKNNVTVFFEVQRQSRKHQEIQIYKCKRTHIANIHQLQMVTQISSFERAKPFHKTPPKRIFCIDNKWMKCGFSLFLYAVPFHACIILLQK